MRVNLGGQSHLGTYLTPPPPCACVVFGLQPAQQKTHQRCAAFTTHVDYANYARPCVPGRGSMRVTAALLDYGFIYKLLWLLN